MQKNLAILVGLLYDEVIVETIFLFLIETDLFKTFVFVEMCVYNVFIFILTYYSKTLMTKSSFCHFYKLITCFECKICICKRTSHIK